MEIKRGRNKQLLKEIVEIAKLQKEPISTSMQDYIELCLNCSYSDGKFDGAKELYNIHNKKK